MKLPHALFGLSLFTLLPVLVCTIDVSPSPSPADSPFEVAVQPSCQCPTVEPPALNVTPHRRAFDDDVVCESSRSFEHSLMKRADGSGIGVGAGVDLPSVGLSLGNISTKLGNINLTVTNVTIAIGNVNVEDVHVGNISVIVTVPLPGASPINAFSAFTPGSSVATSTASGTSTVSSGTSVTQTATTSTGVLNRLARRATTTSHALPTVSLPPTSASATVSGGPISLNTGSVDTEIGNITIEVGHVNVSVGDITIKNLTIGNIFVLVQIGQPDLTGSLANLTNALVGAGR